MTELQRKQITDELYNCEQGAFPGSAEWRREKKVLMALDVFDSAHPEVIAEIRHRAAEPHREAVERASRMAD